MRILMKIESINIIKRKKKGPTAKPKEEQGNNFKKHRKKIW